MEGVECCSVVFEFDLLDQLVFGMSALFRLFNSFPPELDRRLSSNVLLSFSELNGFGLGQFELFHNIQPCSPYI